MSEGTISNNTATAAATAYSSYSFGGGVGVHNGTFTMTGGTISDNIAAAPFASYGGGVGSNGIFTMTGGTISGNSAAGPFASRSCGGGVYSGRTFTMSGGTISGNIASSVSSVSSYGGGVYGTLTMSGGTINGNSAVQGGGVYVDSSISTFTKTGRIVYGDTDRIAGNGNATDNTATSTSNPGTNGHAVFYSVYDSDSYYYRNETLADGAGGNISTADPLPAESGDVLNNWTKR
jgi:hypothetical protein